MDPRRRALVAALVSGSLPDPTMAEPAALHPVARKIPSTGESLPVIGLGTWQTFDVGADQGQRAVLRDVLKLLDKNVVDSSPMYGSSESVTGDLMAELKVRDKLFVATKVWTSGREAGIRQMEESFRKLRVQRMDLMQVHNLVDVKVHTQSILDLKQKQKVRYIGITHYTASAYAEVERAMKAAPYDFLQINYSLAERDAERRLLPLAAEKGMAVIVNRPFAERALFRKTKGKPLPPWAHDLGISTWAQYFLKWIVGHSAVTCAIPGTGRPAHMRDNLAAGTGPLPDAAARRRMHEYLDA
jgi:diketogulonate reductase-like aldo/keto reductase